MSNKLDALGWHKVFIDTRDRIPIPSFKLYNMFRNKKTHRQKWNEFVQSKKVDEKKSSTQETIDDDGNLIVATINSKDIYKYLNNNDRLQVPAGHSVLVANSKNEVYQEFSAQGRPVMDKLTRDVLNEILNINI